MEMPPLESPTSRKLQLVSGTDEDEFVRRCVAGEKSAQRALFERERLRLHRLLFRMVGSNLHVDDLLQEAFLEIFRSLPTFRGESSLRTWMDRCTTRVAFAYFRQKSRRPAMESVQEVPSLVPGAEERAALREAARHLYAELDRLEPRQRLAFTLYAIENMPIKEIAEVTESSAGATKLRVWRARRAIEKRAKKDPLLAEFLSAGGEAKEVE